MNLNEEVAQPLLSVAQSVNTITNHRTLANGDRSGLARATEQQDATVKLSGSHPSVSITPVVLSSSSSINASSIALDRRTAIEIIPLNKENPADGPTGSIPSSLSITPVVLKNGKEKKQHEFRVKDSLMNASLSDAANWNGTTGASIKKSSSSNDSAKDRDRDRYRNKDKEKDREQARRDRKRSREEDQQSLSSGSKPAKLACLSGATLMGPPTIVKAESSPKIAASSKSNCTSPLSSNGYSSGSASSPNPLSTPPKTSSNKVPTPTSSSKRPAHPNSGGKPSMLTLKCKWR